VRSGIAAADVPETSVLLALVSRGQYDEAIAGFLKRMDRFGQSARDAYGLAVAYSRSQRRAEAVRYATLAIQLDDKLKQLSDEELKTCRDILASR
jgi:tetratricopeptide (TPR) repeat protein